MKDALINVRHRLRYVTKQEHIYAKSSNHFPARHNGSCGISILFPIPLSLEVFKDANISLLIIDTLDVSFFKCPTNCVLLHMLSFVFQYLANLRITTAVLCWPVRG